MSKLATLDPASQVNLSPVRPLKGPTMLQERAGCSVKQPRPAWARGSLDELAVLGVACVHASCTLYDDRIFFFSSIPRLRGGRSARRSRIRNLSRTCGWSSASAWSALDAGASASSPCGVDSSWLANYACSHPYSAWCRCIYPAHSGSSFPIGRLPTSLRYSSLCTAAQSHIHIHVRTICRFNFVHRVKYSPTASTTLPACR
ncbi:hypothetical protein P170DRAFT_94947 [Aspergillus steynii IBT 23096]|uniref:Uncharacterized protein n=1 Tax=Aspergillus steynii IBT 23096 TaxID=1392250 RepID=A0A2I2GGH0_9EURO|nr:uncharacterized protein P170DRAFT_94947 [Aspergillus steynii IBT 23096]PLB51981.1 hypothetical protein P170DRAFT_94947 [Aspergillus steynii IBT 23096]